MTFSLAPHPTLRYWPLLLLLFSRCTADPPRLAATTAATGVKGFPHLKPPLHDLGDQWVTGDFDGDQQPDTVCQFLIVDSTGQRFTERPDSTLILEADELSAWYLAHDVRVVLTFSRPGSDTLRLAYGQGLYCLLNLGDTNHDRRDELALVVNYSDFSRVNSCKIVSRCHGRWVVQPGFNVFEEAFDDNPPAAGGIKGFLEKRQGQWYYTDYLEDIKDDSNSWHPLRVKRCL